MWSGANHLHVIIIIYVLHDVYEALEQVRFELGAFVKAGL